MKKTEFQKNTEKIARLLTVIEEICEKVGCSQENAELIALSQVNGDPANLLEFADEHEEEINALYDDGIGCCYDEEDEYDDEEEAPPVDDEDDEFSDEDDDDFDVEEEDCSFGEMFAASAHCIRTIAQEEIDEAKEQDKAFLSFVRTA